jgi:hypothetical protein
MRTILLNCAALQPSQAEICGSSIKLGFVSHSTMRIVLFFTVRADCPIQYFSNKRRDSIGTLPQSDAKNINREYSEILQKLIKFLIKRTLDMLFIVGKPEVLFHISLFLAVLRMVLRIK